jgi:hypothetical protein
MSKGDRKTVQKDKREHRKIWIVHGSSTQQSARQQAGSTFFSGIFLMVVADGKGGSDCRACRDGPDFLLEFHERAAE